ncbi:MAG: hypothetical protein KKA60_08885 [Proteobacteria bacterium]|nr:hypothetical protein [Pseudomonadota bacterium]
MKHAILGTFFVVHPVFAYLVAKPGFTGKRLKQSPLGKEAEPPFEKGGQGGFLFISSFFLSHPVFRELGKSPGKDLKQEERRVACHRVFRAGAAFSP